MEAKDFSAWIAQMGFSDTEAAVALDLSRISVAKYKSAGAPGSVGLACAALASGLPAWRAMPSGETGSGIPPAVQDLVQSGETPIRAWRVHHGFTFRELSRRSGLALSHLYRVEAGSVQPTTKTIAALARVFGTDFEALMRLYDQTTPEPA